MRQRLLACVVGLAVVLGAMAQAGAAVMYRVVDLGTLGGSMSEAYAINDIGQVVGRSELAGGGTRAFRTAPNKPINPPTDNLGTLGGAYSEASDVNNFGQVVGWSELPGQHQQRAFRTGPNQAINPATDDLGTLGGPSSFAWAINDAGQVVGQAQVGDRGGHAFRTARNQPINPATDDLGTFGDLTNSLTSNAEGINAAGQVVGNSLTSDGVWARAFRTVSERTINPLTDDLGTLGAPWSAGGAINASGQVAGVSGPATSPDEDGSGSLDHLFRTGPNRAIDPATDDLGALDWERPRVTAMNDAGEIVGMYYAPPAYALSSAFVVLGSTIFDLNDLIDPASGWLLREANDINNLGQIVGWGEHDGHSRAFRLDSVPEPSAILLITFGSLTALGRRPRATGR